MTALITPIQIANGTLCLLLAGYFFLTEARHKVPARLLGGNYLLYACQSFLLVGRLNELLGPFMILRPTFAMLIGPAFYLYFQSVKDINTDIKAWQSIHLLPALVVGSLLLLNSPLMRYLDYIFLTSYLGYLLYVGFRVRRGPDSLAHLMGHAGTAFRWICFLGSLLFVSFLFEIVILLELNSGKALGDARSLLIGNFFFLCICSYTVFAALRRSPLLEWMHEIGEQVIYKRGSAKLEPERSKEIIAKWSDLMEKEKLFKLEFGITLSEAAKKLQVPARHLSNAINQEFGESFSKHLNRLRVAQAQKLFAKQPTTPVIDIMYESGFSSKSNFNKEFLRITGMTPSHYRDGLMPMEK